MTRLPDASAASALRLPLAALLSGVVVVQVCGRINALRSVLRRLGPLIFGSCIFMCLMMELIFCYPLLLPFNVWPRAAHKEIAKVLKVWKRCLWPLILWCCPWVKVDVKNRGLISLLGADRTRGTVLVMNHTSFFDAPLALCYWPWRVAALHRVLAMASVMRMPLIGHLFKSEMHIPVHFRSDAKDSFKLKEGTREVVEAEMSRTLAEKEILIVYPEGQINSQEITQLAPFRHGTFRIAIQNDAAIWGWLALGNEVVWPYASPMGGFPGRITASPIVLAPEGAVEYMKQNGIATEPREGQSAEELLSEQSRVLAEKIQGVMQAELLKLNRERVAAVAA